MSHALAAPACPVTARGLRAEARRLPADLRIPMPPRGRRLVLRRAEPWWQEALRWSVIGLTASWLAGEVTLALMGL